jgi:hypothetical protein
MKKQRWMMTFAAALTIPAVMAVGQTTGKKGGNPNPDSGHSGAEMHNGEMNNRSAGHKGFVRHNHTPTEGAPQNGAHTSKHNKKKNRNNHRKDSQPSSNPGPQESLI